MGENTLPTIEYDEHNRQETEKLFPFLKKAKIRRTSEKRGYVFTSTSVEKAV
jgi:hypothetical protein